MLLRRIALGLFLAFAATAAVPGIAPAADLG